MTTAEKFNRPPVPMVHHTTRRKIRLKLRVTSLDRETRDFPSDLLELHNKLILTLTSRNSSIYDIVTIWIKLNVYEQFWKSFNFDSEEDYLSRYGLPDGETLKGLTTMVQFFDQETFILLGGECLNFMVRAVNAFQKEDIDEKKKDYQAIFDRYCDHNEHFDKQKFYDTVRYYITEKYEKPTAKAQGIPHAEFKKRQNHSKFGRRFKRVVVDAQEDQSYGPRVKSDFAWREEMCPSCRAKDQVLAAFDTYVKILEGVIKEKFGEGALPNKPELLKDL